MQLVGRATLRTMAALSMIAVGISFSNAQDDPRLLLELNAVQPSDKGGCRLTFLVNNGLGGDLEKAAFEMALFNEAGVVERLAVLDFSDLPIAKTKVRRFDLANADCAKISRVLINSATACKGAGIEPTACIRQLKTETRTGIAFGT